MELAELQSLIDMLRANGVTSYRNGDLELELGAATVTNTSVEEKTAKTAVDPTKDDLRGLPGQYRRLFEVVQ